MLASKLRRCFSTEAATSALHTLFASVAAHEMSADDAMAQWRHVEYDALEAFAKIDGQRAARTGFPEVVYAEGKTSLQVASILLAMQKSTDVVMATRVSAAMAADVLAEPGLEVPASLFDSSLLQCIRALNDVAQIVCVLCAGTSDLPVAEEAAVTLELAGLDVRRIYDVGVAGLHRLLRHRRAVEDGDVIIVVAGMDGALPGVVGGLTTKPIVAVPTSVGYGAAFAGLAPLLTMLNACSPGVGVVNIDNGFGAAVLAHRIVAAHPKTPST
ncbi:hypothetical protein SPRG_08595 [Saprolegnia parasitica CBS 223.65]|uniref:phosphoribosylaminoimidazole carboxylase n=1 Tax=Saprolegnia parasitica (strain CBS 223.65) TaxID=695850 RepID=A0A067C9T4_SAPPC|nr:hypothetical protein SPRG_08595 [Saprolegnia parasitica CBS 223.65]KDO25940.1 hypothetical protein SPRG_08595 [Saprolegnia parasitica CBS 223.65]|eukprot:XP_012203229.1 hypothetical protein SPRG_08595 [Saprolegnia parasitica CBS 223.65]